MSDHQQGYDSLSGCLLRLFWLLAGNALLVLVGLQILFSGAPLFSSVDVFYWSIVVLILAARFADIVFFKGATEKGEPPSIRDWWRHALVLVVAAGMAWLALHLTVYLLGLNAPAT